MNLKLLQEELLAYHPNSRIDRRQVDGACKLGQIFPETLAADKPNRNIVQAMICRITLPPIIANLYTRKIFSGREIVETARWVVDQKPESLSNELGLRRLVEDSYQFTVILVETDEMAQYLSGLARSIR